MDSITSKEKLVLIRDHAFAIAETIGGNIPQRSVALASAQRIIELAQSIPEDDWIG